MKVKCTNCGRTDFETNDKYNPDAPPNGSMLKCLLPYHIDWLLTSTTTAAMMTCPECLAQLAPSGRLTVLPEQKTLMETEEAMVEQFETMDKDEIAPKVGKKVYVCDICGKEVSSALALNGHKRSHKEAVNG